MQFNFLAPVQAVTRPKNQFSLFFVAFFVAKLLHLGSHFTSLPIILYLLYFPTFLLPDIILVVVSKVVIYRHNGGQSSATRKIIGGALALFTTACSASQISFFIETGGEIQWMAASRILGGSGGLGLVLSGLPSMIVAFFCLYAMSLVISPRFYDAVEDFLAKISNSFRQTYTLFAKTRLKSTEEHELLMSFQDDSSSTPSTDDQSGAKSKKQIRNNTSAVLTSVGTIAFAITVAILQFVRPITPPYAHMSGSLPLTLIEAALFQPINSEFCLPHPVQVVLFPFDRFTKFYNKPEALDWVPMSRDCKRDDGPGPPPWIASSGSDGPGNGPGNSNAPRPPGEGPEHHKPHHGPPPPGHPPHHGPPPPPPIESHPRSESATPYSGVNRPPRSSLDSSYSFAHLLEPPRHGQGQGPIGESPCEPLALSNSNASVIGTLAKKIQHNKPRIKNVLLITLESTRKDIFPLIKDSHMYKTLLSTYSSEDESNELDARLRGFADNAAFLTGQPSGFGTVAEDLPEGHWRNSFKNGMGAININGAITQAAYTLKSILSSHCGVEPLAVDFAEETRGTVYQPCLPQIFDKLGAVVAGRDLGRDRNRLNKKDENADYNSLDWESAYIQSVTDQFDNQNVLNEQMGFKNVVVAATISNESSKHYPPKQAWSNYFGFPETESLPYFRDLFVNAKAQDKRLFVSHLTSTPHHPFKTPSAWQGSKRYTSSQRWRPDDPLEGYLNAIQYQDDWISEIFQMLKDIDVLDETLIVMTGDHGLAFSSPDGSQSAVNNGHVSNFRIPLLLIHPDLPRAQVNASTTPLSILPTILDLLLESDSLPEPAAAVAKEILPQYLGNSLIRNMDFSVGTGDGTSAESFFGPFHFGAINPGGSLIAISDAFTSFRLLLPLCSNIALRFSDVSTDPYEANAIEAWTMDELVAVVKVRHGDRAKEWAKLAQEMGRWWVWKQREKWGYWGNAREISRGGAEVGGAVGRIKKEHWWETKRKA